MSGPVVKVEEAVERKPFKKARVVEVAFSPEPRVVNGKVNELPLPHPVQLVTVRLPMFATFALRLVEEAKFETKKSEAVAFWRVEEPRTRKLVE